MYHITTGNKKRQQTGVCGQPANLRFKATDEYQLAASAVRQIQSGEVDMCQDCVKRLEAIRKGYLAETQKSDVHSAPTQPEPIVVRKARPAPVELPASLIPGAPADAADGDKDE